jgi:AraC-like DNA-binding protein
MRKNVLLVMHDQQEAHTLLNSLQSVYNVFVAGSREEAYRLLTTVSIQLIICNAEAVKAAGFFTNSHFETNGDDDFINKLNSFIAVNLNNHSLQVDLLARLMHISRPTLYRKIKTITNLTPNELIHQARLQQAAELLESGSYKVFEIAKMVGFQTQSSFGKAFTKQFRLTPTQYLQMKKPAFTKS